MKLLLFRKTPLTTQPNLHVEQGKSALILFFDNLKINAC